MRNLILSNLKCFAMFALCLGFISVGNCADLPWSSGLQTLQDSLTGPVAKGICLIGIVGCGAGLAFGGEMSQFMKTILILVLVACLIMGANMLLEALAPASSGSSSADLNLVNVDALAK